MVRHVACIILVFFAVLGCVSAKGWLTYEKCELVDEKYFDGDSFSAKAQTGHTYVFRLYGVDCPETDKRIKSRLVEQAKEFKIDEKDVIKWGEKAAKFTRKFLRKPFTVYTQKIEAGGTSKKNRYYAIIVNSEGKRLDEALIEAGLARVDGFYPEWKEPFWGKADIKMPRKSDRGDFERRLKRLQIKAKNAQQGVWEK